MPALMQSVFSSTVVAVGHDADTNELVVEFKNGSVYHYEGVDAGTADALSRAPSVGVMLNTDIKPFYKFRRVR